MPLPLPNLDTRRWADLVDEGRALIPRYAPEWTDHNAHDPGITIMELLAFLVEQDIYRVNQVPDRHRAKFLALAGFAPEPPRPAQTVLTITLDGATPAQFIPAGLVFVAGDGRRFRTADTVTLTEAAIQAVHVFDGQTYVDRTRLWQEGIAFAPWGPAPASAPESGAPDPETRPAFYVSFDAPLPTGQPVSLGLWFGTPPISYAERAALWEEERNAAICPPAHPSWPCTPEEAASAASPEKQPAPALPPHHSLRTAWEYYDGSMWRTLDPALGEVIDDTRALTLNGMVHLTLPSLMAPVAVGERPPAPALRCRIVSGRADAVIHLRRAALNAISVEQMQPVTGHFAIAPGVTPPVGQEPVPGTTQQLTFTLNAQGQITTLAAGPDANGPATYVIAYQPATVSDPGGLTTTLVPLETGRGIPGQRIRLPARQIAHGALALWTLGDSGFQRWEARPDLDASGPEDHHVVLDATAGEVMFGDGVKGRVVPEGVPVLGQFDRTDAASGNIAAGASWALDANSAALNQALLGEDPADVMARLAAITNPEAAFGGADHETLTHTAGRAAEVLWAHERLVELAAAHDAATLDQLERGEVLRRRTPDRAVTLLDFERLALSVPGTRIARARAWAGIDPAYPCLQAPGTVTVIVVPELPTTRPTPSAGLIRAVERFLDRRRVIGTRLVVTGPHYITISIQARIQARSSARAARVQQSVIAALTAFLDPLHGGPQGRGWPFGRDVYRSEILQVIDDVPGVDHVLALVIAAEDDDGACGNLCIGPTTLAVPGTLSIEVI